MLSSQDLHKSPADQRLCSPIPIGGARFEASGAGTWKGTISLIDLGLPSVHVLRAVAESSGIQLHSKKIFATFDPDQPISGGNGDGPAAEWQVDSFGC